MWFRSKIGKSNVVPHTWAWKIKKSEILIFFYFKYSLFSTGNEGPDAVKGCGYGKQARCYGAIGPLAGSMTEPQAFVWPHDQNWNIVTWAVIYSTFKITYGQILGIIEGAEFEII